MNISLLPFCLSFFIFLSCSQIRENNINSDKKFNNNLFDLSSNNISNGNEDFTNILGANSTVYIYLGESFCSGTVVSSHYVITAAHCVYNQNTHLKKSPSNVDIMIGKNVSDLINTQKIKVKNIYINEIYQDPFLKYTSLGDIALIETEDNLVYKYSLTPAKIMLGKPSASEKLLSIGYGVTGNYDEKTGGVKRWALSSVGSLSLYMSQNDKRKIDEKYTIAIKNQYVSDKYDATDVKDTFLVTHKSRQSEGQVCFGDSGGPQFVIRNDEAVLISASEGFNPYWQGIDLYYFMKSGKDICTYRSALNTRIAPYVDWLNNIMKFTGESLVLVSD
jgi:secreted trypsin-like serine protease